MRACKVLSLPLTLIVCYQDQEDSESDSPPIELGQRGQHAADLRITHDPGVGRLCQRRREAGVRDVHFLLTPGGRAAQGKTGSGFVRGAAELFR